MDQKTLQPRVSKLENKEKRVRENAVDQGHTIHPVPPLLIIGLLLLPRSWGAREKICFLRSRGKVTVYKFWALSDICGLLPTDVIVIMIKMLQKL